MTNKQTPDIYHAKITKQNLKEAMMVFFGEAAIHLLLYGAFGTMIGLYFIIGFWCVVGVVPIGLLVYYVMTKQPFVKQHDQEQHHQKQHD